jgi:thiol-disulfide isomerase/thioredoxin
MKKKLGLILLTVIGIGVAFFFYKRYKVPPAIELPALALTDLSGQPVALSSYGGKPLFISYFASWCGPCLREMPELVTLQEALADKQLQVICISDESLPLLQRVQERVGPSLRILHSTIPMHDMGIYTYPTNYIYHARGQKVYDQVNPDHWADPAVIDRVRKLLE